MIVRDPPPPARPSLARRINTAIAWSFGMVALGFAIQIARAALHVITGKAP